MNGPRLYLITPPLRSEAESFAPALEQALSAAPVACVRLRMAGEDEATIARAADWLREICHSHDVALILTDHFRLVRPLGLDGVHLCNPRLSVRRARKELGPDAIVGAFAGASRHQGLLLAEAGADYISFGPMADDGLGDGAVAAAEIFHWWSEMITTPAVAEGGMTPGLARSLGKSADFVAAGGEVWNHPEGPAAGVRAFSDALGD